MAATYNFTIDEGETWNLSMTWYTDSTKTTEVDLTGYTGRMKIKESFDGADILELTTANGKITLGGVAGTISLDLTEADTTSLEPRSYVYDLELVVGSTVKRLIEGTINVTRSVTT
mgnify:CR=1 FL=1